MLKHKYDFVLLFDVTNGNPNGDPDAGNDPRIDFETNYGYVTDVCIKRKVRNYIDIIKNGQPGFNILIKNDRSLNEKFREVYKQENLQSIDKNSKKSASFSRADENIAKKYMCQNYFDVRTFGAVMTTGNNSCGKVQGPVQLSFAESISPINITNVSIIRMAITREEDMWKDNTMPHKSIVPYGLYRMNGHISAALANNTTDMTEEDVSLLWESLLNMFEEDRSAARGEMEVRGLYIFQHDSILGNARFSELQNRIRIFEKEGVTAPRSFEDYQVIVDDQNLPEGITLIRK